MKNLEMFAASFGMLFAGGTMISYEWSRARAKRPLFDGRQVASLYWMAYLTLLVLGVTFGLAAVLHE